MKLIIATCLLVMTITMIESKREKKDVQCQDATDVTSDLYDCLVEYAKGSCTSDCKTLLEEYADDCLGSEAAAEAYKDTLDQVCGGGDGDDATTVAATLFSTFTALLVAMAAAIN